MIIEIQSPEFEALVMQRMRSGGFRNVEDVLIAEATSIATSFGKPTPTPRKRPDR